MTIRHAVVGTLLPLLVVVVLIPGSLPSDTPEMKGRALHQWTEAVRLRRHFDLVGKALRASDTSGLAHEQRAKRAEMIRWLGDYRNAGRFPENLHDSGRVPIFRDDAGTLCAMAYLIARSGETGLVESVSRSRNTAYISELVDAPLLVAWLDDAGLSVEEAARIQPTYGPCDNQPCPPPVPEGTKVTPGFGTATVATGGLSVAAFVRSVASPTRERGWEAVFAGGVETLLGLSEVHRGGATGRVAWSNIAVGGITLSAGIRAIGRAARGPAPQARPAARKTIDVSLYSPFQPGEHGRKIGAHVRLTFR